LNYKESSGLDSWQWNNELELEVKIFPEELSPIKMDEEYIGYFFQ
jgi:hypothetical protein